METSSPTAPRSGWGSSLSGSLGMGTSGRLMMSTLSKSVSILVVLSLLAANLAAADPAGPFLYLRPSFSLASVPPPPLAEDPPPAPKVKIPPAPAGRGPGYKPHPLLAAAEVAGINLGVWAFLLYFGNAFYSYISWETIEQNIRDGWEWDRSRYFVNFYHHPYHGYLYYSAGRANGLDYWGSALCAMGGSL